MNLVVVESPTKAKKIKKFLGKDFTVVSSKGHIVDLPKSSLGVNVEEHYLPDYVKVDSKKKVIKELRKLSKESDHIFLATDPDREGEAIAWHVAAIMQGKDVNKLKSQDLDVFHRVVFHEITPEAVKSSFSHPRLLDMHLFDAQQARRILDRLVGYKLSPLLWKKIRYGLSAGRVQSVGLRLIVERERERESFKAEKFFRVWADLDKEGDLTAVLVSKKGKKYEQKRKIDLFAGSFLSAKTTIDSVDSAEKIIKDVEKEVFVVDQVSRKEIRDQAVPPFITSSLQREAVNRLNLSSKQTMRWAQKLYEEGFITYHRTDSVNLAESFVKQVREYIQSVIGKDFLSEKVRHYKSKSKTAQEAHEAIRPTQVVGLEDNLAVIEKKIGSEAVRLYKLIWSRAVASQMSDAVYDQVSVSLRAGDYLFRLGGRSLLFAGWKKVMNVHSDSEEMSSFLSQLKEGDKVEVSKLFSTEHETALPPRYTEASLIKDLESYEIGRPSTYSSIVSTILQRHYVGKEGKYFYPEDTGLVVSDLLVAHFPNIVDLEFTASMEGSLDDVAQGNLAWEKVVDDFYSPFASLLEKKMEEIDKNEVVVMGKTDKKCPECGKDLVVKLGKYGRFISCSGFPECDYAEFIDNPHTAEDEGAVDESQLEGVCPECGKSLTLRQGRYGRFISCSGYPKCKYTKNYLEKIGMKCPECGEGEVIIKRTRRGRIFYGCSRYPECKYASWKNPLEGEKEEDEGHDEK